MKYNDTESAKNYINFLNSLNGKVQQRVLSDAIFKCLPKDHTLSILDAACGPGWLTQTLSAAYPTIQGFDSSDELITQAKKNYPTLSFTASDISNPLPYQKESFDIVILNMAAPDISNLETAFANIFSVLKKNGHYIMTVPNPYYTYPIAVWKRSLLDVLLFRKPKLIIETPYKQAKNIVRDFGNDIKFISNFYTLGDYLDAAKKVGMQLQEVQEIKSSDDSKNFDLQYQLYRYPLFLMLEFKKL